MMDEELHRVLLFLMNTLNKFPGWTHQGMLKQELYAAQLDGTLHRILGSSPMETFTEFLKCFPTIFCINNNQLVQLSVKNGSISDSPGLPLVDGVGMGPNMKPPDDYGGVHSTSVLPVGTRKLPDPHLDWSPAPMPIVPESTKMGYLGCEPSQPLQPNNTPIPGTLCGIPASYPCSAAVLNQRSSVGGWDPVGHSLPDLHQSFLGSDVHRGRSLGHLTNGWDRSARTNTIPNCQPRYPESAGGIGDSSRLALNQRWEGSSHSITDSLKNFSLSDAASYQGTGANVTSTTGNTAEAGHTRWLPYPPLSGNSIDSFPSNGSGNGHYLRPLGSMWDEPIQSTSSPCQAPPPPPQQSFLHCGTNDTGLSSHNTFLSQQWEDPLPTPVTVPDSPSPLGFSSFGGLGSSAKQQYYEWTSPSPAVVKEPVGFSSTNETPLHEENNADTASPENVENPSLVTSTTLTKAEPQPILSLTPVTTLAEEINAEPSTVVMKGPTSMGLNALNDMAISSAAASTTTIASTIPPTVALSKGATLSYAEALRSNTQRRKAASENASTSSVPSPYLTQMLPASLKLSISTLGSAERQGKSRRSLDGRCGKVENLNAGDGTLRLGNGKVYFEKTIFYDSGKPVADLRNVLKANDTVYFDAMLDGSGGHDWKATLAWVGKKPRSASASSPTTPNPVGRGYRSSENNQGCNTTTNNGFPSRSGAPGSLLGGSKVCSRERDRESSSITGEATVEGTGEVVILFAHFGFIRRGKKFKENVHFNRNVFYASGNRVKELTDVLKEGSTVNYVAVPSDKKSCKWKAVLVWTGARPKV